MAKLMREAGICGKTPRLFKVTTDSNHGKPLAGNFLERHFAPAKLQAPNRVWTSDIPCPPRREGCLYLAVVLDLFSRKVVGWSMSHRLESRLVLDALQMAADRPAVEPTLLVHSDRACSMLAMRFSAFTTETGCSAA